MKVERHGDEVVITLKAKDPLLKEIAKLLKKAGRGEECKAIEAAADEPPSDPGGE